VYDQAVLFNLLILRYNFFIPVSIPIVFLAHVPLLRLLPSPPNLLVLRLFSDEY